MESMAISITLLVYCLLREVFFAYQFNKLANKLMSRNYHEYEMAKKVGKLDKKPAVRDEERLESVDIGQLVGIG